MLTEMVAQLDRPETLVPEVSELCRRHGQCGVRDADYETVGAALLWTLEQRLGRGVHAALREAWTEGL